MKPNELDEYNELLNTVKELEEKHPELFTALTSDAPKVVIALDEAQCLTTIQNTLSEDGKAEWRPSHMFCRVIASFSNMRSTAAIWLLFASTNSKIGDFSPPSKLRTYDSHGFAI